MASQRDFVTGGTKRPCRAYPRTRRMAHHDQARRSRQHHAFVIATQGDRFDRHGEHLEIHARQLAIKLDLHILRRDRRALLRGLEQAFRSALEDHVHRHAKLGAWVLINVRWY